MGGHSSQWARWPSPPIRAQLRVWCRSGRRPSSDSCCLAAALRTQRLVASCRRCHGRRPASRNLRRGRHYKRRTRMGCEAGAVMGCPHPWWTWQGCSCLLHCSGRHAVVARCRHAASNEAIRGSMPPRIERRLLHRTHQLCQQRNPAPALHHCAPPSAGGTTAANEHWAAAVLAQLCLPVTSGMIFGHPKPAFCGGRPGFRPPTSQPQRWRQPGGQAAAAAAAAWAARHRAHGRRHLFAHTTRSVLSRARRLAPGSRPHMVGALCGTPACRSPVLDHRERPLNASAPFAARPTAAMAASGGEAAAAAADGGEPLPRVLSIQSHVVSGYVGNKVSSSRRCS